ncbi:MAG: indole-3-glycerol phosphate synthase TrpC [Chitinophagaceae bacterium]|nr:indole-3-glycerol phosphate synthase TrpC [Chitinophagaceae bacterium]
MNILEKIIEHKKLEVTQHRMSAPMQELQSSEYFYRPCLSLKQSLQNKNGTGIIAEFKRQSPSKGVINGDADVIKITGAYTLNGAAGLSVLTDKHFFGGSNGDLLKARANHIPVLRKDFIIDEYQIVEAKSIGADVILLIAACLHPEEVKRLAVFAKSIGLEVLLEIHNEEELKHICDECDMVGVNNRDLKTFTVNVNRSIELSAKIPSDKIKISESGISDIETIILLRRSGFQGFLMGEHFMKENDPAIAFAAFVNSFTQRRQD